MIIRSSEAFTHRIIGAFGKEGEKWLRRLPSIIVELSNYWGIRILDPFEDMTYNYVAPAVREDGSEVVLKIGVLRRELRNEIAALRAFNGNGAARILDDVPDLGAFLLERLRPGSSLFNLDDDEAATAIACDVIKRLGLAEHHEAEYPSVSDWANGLQKLRFRFDGGTGPFPEDLVDSAENIFRELLSSMDESILLHGDLHHWNILSAGSERWLAIDPQGVIGEQAYETGAWLRNPWPNILEIQDVKRVILRRVDQFEDELNLDRERILGWGLAQAVLAAWWSYEDADVNWPLFLECANIFVSAK